MTVQPGDAVGPLGEPEAHDRHVEHAGVAALVVLGAQRQDALHRHAGLRVVAAEVLRHELAREAVDAGRDRGVGREDRARPRHLQGGVEADALLLGELTDPLETQEAGVALVGVEDLGVGCARDAGVGPDGAHATDAEQHLLPQPVLGLAAVEPVGDVAQHLLGVVLDVGVEQQQRHPADLGDPDARRRGVSLGHPHGDLGRGPVGLAQDRDRQLVGVEHRVALLLPPVARERLPEVAVPVEQADADDRHAEVAGRLEVVAGQDAQAAGVLRQCRGDAELGREVGDGARPVLGQRLVPAVAVAVADQVLVEVVQPLAEAVVLRQLGEPGRGDHAQHARRVAVAAAPELGVDALEEVLGRGVPGPPEVARDLPQGGQRIGEDRTDGESSDRTHPAHASPHSLDRSNPRVSSGTGRRPSPRPRDGFLGLHGPPR